MRPSHTSSVVDSPAVHSENWVYTLKGADGLPYKMVAQEGTEENNMQDLTEVLRDRV